MLSALRHRYQNARDWLRRPADLIQANRTPFEVIFSDDIVSLRYYPPLTDEHIIVNGETLPVTQTRQPIPLVLVTPLAANTLLYDLFEDRSLVRYLRARGFEVYLIDWGRPRRRHDAWTLETYFADWLPKLLAEVRQHSGSQKLALHGWSFGALFSYCYTALGDDPDIAALSLIGAPGDYHANGALGVQYQRLSRQLRGLKRRTGRHVHQLPAALLRSPGWVNALSFKAVTPVSTLKGYLDLLRNLDDRQYVSNHATNAAFLDDMFAYPGAVIQDIVRHLWTDNCVARGRLPMRHQRGDLASVSTPVLLITGRQDTIVTADCSLALRQQMPAAAITHHVVKGGHMGILGGSNAPVDNWPVVADWLANIGKAAHAESGAATSDATSDVA
ncbi:alpha/beta fold hydrolase [Alcanivorax sp. JB21]|uniref:alpha/beta fold hydrolase n=1 Tax=Alcanivorax limicola TaxID=2874102 RepID=UPI001CBFFE5E|nr:alpha/beta fold hydrolase [Alcanivorax limicola]MBZ2189348.1 alpha/beta fold hydrolase [Alcanivorax limicola]